MRAIAVDDEKLALDSLRTKLGHIERISEIYTFHSQDEALEFTADNNVDIAFLDISMAQMNGLALAGRLREISPSIIIIFVTGYTEYAMEALQLHADGYLMKPIDEMDIENELDALEKLQRKPNTKKRIHVQCFGDFEIFVDNIPVSFTRAKSKELLAYLIDRRGAKCSASQIAAVIWEDGIYDRSRQKQLGVLRAEMLKSLKAVGADSIVLRSRDALSVLPHMIDCDYYKALEGDVATLNLFCGEYMTTYSWAEYTAAYIAGNLSNIKT